MLPINRKKGKCKNCGKEFELFRSYRNICSHQCGKEYDGIKPNVKKPRKPQKHLGKAAKIKQAMIADVGYAYCEKCGVTGVRLECHHIVYQSEMPNHEHLHDKRNLIILCKGCHDWYHEIKSRREPLIEQRGLTELFGNEILTKKM